MRSAMSDGAGEPEPWTKFGAKKFGEMALGIVTDGRLTIDHWSQGDITLSEYRPLDVGRT